jgi:ArsR family transcriptional regulator
VNVPLASTTDPACCEPLALGPTRDAEQLVEIVKALGDPVRLQIIGVLKRHGQPVCVCDLQPLFDITQPTLSHHLKRLREAGLVRVDRRQQWAFYSLVPERMEVLAQWLS